ncbi:MAG: desulfoferrodoxin family protein [Planctomycetota bacterium]
MSPEQTSEKTNLFVGVNEPVDPNNLSDLEKKHLPVIDAPDKVKINEPFEVTIEVGRLLAHPNEHKHFIQFLDLYADDTYLGRADFTSVKSCPKTTFCISLDAPYNELRAYEHCNLHGTWVYHKPVKVTEGT